MKLLPRIFAPAALALTLDACSVGGLLGGGAPPPTNLVTLTPETPEPGEIVRAAAAGQTVTVGIPIATKELRSVRVPVQVSPTDIQYVANLQLVDTPDRLFQGLVAETVRRTTSRVVIDPNQTALDPGLLVTGELRRFGFDAQSGQVVVQFDGSMLAAGGNSVQTRRFTAAAPADGTAASVGPALNRAANQVALDVAKWIGG